MENGEGSLRSPGSEHLTAVPGQVQQEQPPQHPNKKKNKEIINPTSTTIPTRGDQDCYMPMANVTRIMRRALPPYAKIADDAKETVQQCVSQYINLVTAEANDHCRRDHRRTVSTEDLLWALRRLGFDNYLEPLALFLNRYREARSERDGVSFPAPANFGRPPAVPVVQPPPGQGVFSAHAAVMNGLDFGYPVDNRTGGGSSFSGPSGNGVGPSFDPYAPFR